MAQVDPVEDLKNTLQEMCAQLREDQVPYEFIEGFSLEDFRPKLVNAVERIGLNAKRICFAFSEPPIPTPPEKASLIACMKKACTDVLAVFAELPRSQGRTLRRDVTGHLNELYDAVMDFVSVINSESDCCLQVAGKLWEKCDGIERIPKDNKEAVCCVLSSHYEFIQDAVNELRESMEEDEALALDLQHMPARNGLNQPRFTWSLQERALLNPGIGLANTFRITMRKVSAAVDSHGRCINMQENEELDKIADLFRVSSSFMDDFVTTLYPPVTATAVQENGATLKAHVLKMLDATRDSHFYNSAEEDWVKFLEHATEHNYQNLLTRIDDL
uniref:Cyclin-D1-binding protein 1-like protein n=1 Tax=Rhipicephalus appendiculatus TaxID=34631 RepID=A0A131YUV9_RHIAP